MQLQTLQDLFEEIADLHSAETQLVTALPQLIRAASNDELRGAFEQHLQETRDHVRRLEDIRAQVGSSKTEQCEGMRGLINESQEIVSAIGDPVVKDAALISAAQRVEHPRSPPTAPLARSPTSSTLEMRRISSTRRWTRRAMPTSC